MLDVSNRVRTVLAGAYGAAAGAPGVGTGHLLAGLAGLPGSGPAARVLDEAELTSVVVMVLLRRRSGQVEEPAGTGEPPLGALDSYPLGKSRPGKPIRYTGPARAVLQRAVTIATDQGAARLDSDHLLEALLAADGATSAVDIVRTCGVDPVWLRERLRGTAGPAPRRGDELPAGLRSTRDALLGRYSYRFGEPGRGQLAGVMRTLISVVLTEAPGRWVELDARDRARRQGLRRPGTEHLVLSTLAIHETVHRYPHLLPDRAPHQYAGGQVLADAGLTFNRAGTAAATDLGTDARRAPSHRRRPWPGPGWRARVAAAVPTGTGELLLAVLTQDDSRAADLLRCTGIAPARVRAQLRTRLRAYPPA